MPRCTLCLPAQHLDCPGLPCNVVLGAGRSTVGHIVVSALSRDAFVSGFDCGAEVAHSDWAGHAASRKFRRIAQPLDEHRHARR